MTYQNTSRVKVGAQLGEALTVLGVIDRHEGDALCIVWHHAAWCPMACKVFQSFRDAEREAKVLSILSHPNTVRFLGLAKPAYLLMEFLEGPTLDKLIYKHPRKRLGISDAIRVAIHIGAGLEHIHQKGLLHLDVKPTNVIVARGGRPVLYDFGSARRQDSARPRFVTGTDPYIAPEECSKRNVAPAADVFGLGVTLYEMLTGKLPFPLGNRKREFPQTRAEATPPGKHRLNIPAGLAELVLSCLARDPADRPVLASLLPALHDHIRTGPRMWPAGFRPDRNTALKDKP
jgi:serine/threonine protein kinase